MRFPFPRFPADFELPDEWWSEAGMPGFARQGSRLPIDSAGIPARRDRAAVQASKDATRFARFRARPHGVDP